ncbi:MAG: hypothetical protein UT61_C0054G0009 [Candidatus Woesebacteria bacterium GW2011_GWA1_39_8]|uniref:Uncharacterized protein n=1 Tax=Candidatus Woesebacteria bacterium GW2011_GWA1_39_8 TaxID=1618552 RepID=A0A0G0SRM5_9BACT|nr:MAG: hypothetical protein UT61_C0054G0009 [Candidatus Woesebacteria bacterium GW2011_GWA1_39_8]
MKFSALKFRKNNGPSLSSLRPALFDVNSHWFVGLGIFFAILIITALIGLKLFYLVYSESYKKETPREVLENLVDINKLKNTIEKRNNFIIGTSTLPGDPSL